MTLGKTIPVWLDCDPGNDDTFAILMAVFHPKFKLLGISTVHGNAPLTNTTHNALGLLDILGLDQGDVKVYSGSDRPLVKEPQFAPEIHGATGIGGTQLPAQPRIVESRDLGYLEAMKTAIESHAGEICVVLTGTFTNFAKLIGKYPELKAKIRFVSIMGGAFGLGNITQYAEFNVYCDPQAAAAVLEDPELSGKTILAPLNITHKAIATETVRRAIYNDQDPDKISSLRKLFYDISMYYAEAYKKNEKMFTGPPIHDPVAVFCLVPVINQEEGVHDDVNYRYRKKRLRVVQDREHEGETQYENPDAAGQDNDGVLVGEDLNTEIFWHYVLEALEIADSNTKNLETRN